MKDGELINKTNGYAIVRLNAVRHGILSRETVLPHESRQDFEFLLNELQNEYAPNGQTEKALVEELASILWRKRRVLAAEGAQINSGIACAMTNSLRVANQATPFLPKITRNELLGDEALPVREILALDAEGLEQRRQALEAEYGSVAKSRQLLTLGGRGAARKALEALPHLAEEKRLLENADSLRRQALGSAVAGLPFESIARYEAHLDRKFERTLSMLIKLKAMKTVPVNDASTPVGQGVAENCMQHVQ